MPENFDPNLNDLPDDETKRKMRERFAAGMLQLLETEEVLELRKWMESATETEIRNKLESLQRELMKLYEKGKVKGKAVSPEEEKLREKIEVLDRHLNPEI